MKTCAKCGITKLKLEFSRRAKATDGKHPYCNACVKALNRAAYEANPERYKEYATNWQKANPERRKEISRNAAKRHHEKHPHAAYAASKKWARANKEKIKVYDSCKKAKRRLRMTSVWDLELDRLVFGEAASLCLLREQITGFQWQVDHIVPLQCCTASGLHNAFNIAVVPATYNASKKNTFVRQHGFVTAARL